MVWSAVHEYGWSLPDVSEFRITLQRYVEATGDREQAYIWRDARGRFRSVEFLVLKPVVTGRRVDDAWFWLSGEAGGL
jgi:hypothetical protein